MLKKFLATLSMGVLPLALVPATASPALATDNPLTIATGRILNSLGQVVPNASIELQMWPSDATLAAAQEGDPVNLVTVASATTNSVGDFHLVLPRIADLAPGAGGDSIVDFTLAAVTPTGETSYFAFSRRLVNTDILGLKIEAVVDPEMPQNLINQLISGLTQQIVVPLTGLVLGENGITGTIDDTLPSTPVLEDEVPEDVFVPVEEEPVVEKASCSTEAIKDYGHRVSQVNAAGVGWSGATTDFGYTEGATSTLGVAMSMSGAYGSYSAGGSAGKTVDRATTMSEDFAAKSTGYWSRKTNFRYKKYKITCFYGSTMYGTYVDTRYEVRPSNWAGGATSYGSTTLPKTPRGYCVPQEAGSAPAKSVTAAITWSNGVALKAVIGVDVSSRTGYSSDARVSFKFNQRGYLCGTHGDPADVPRTLVARKYLPAA